jgi:hypothetical protein
MDFIRVVNEELRDFDFLKNDAYNKEKEVFDLLSNEDFQKQFICDSLLNRRDKIKISITDSRVGGNWDNSNPEDVNYLTLEYFMNIEYKYDPSKEPVRFVLDFDSDRIDVSASGWYNPGSYGRMIEPEGDSWIDSINWLDINTTIFDTTGEEVDFKAFKRAPVDIQNLFIRAYTEDYIESSTMKIKTGEKINKPAIINSYC